MHYFSAGYSIILREIFHGQIWTARPFRVVEDKSEATILYMVPGTVIKHPRELQSDLVPLHLLTQQWRLVDKVWTGGGALYLARANQPYMIIGFRTDDNKNFNRWYINLQNPLSRTSLGFDYLDMELDIEIDAQLNTYAWKDEDKFHILVAQGVISEVKAKKLRLAGEQIIQKIMDGESIIEDWKNWTPTEKVSTPILPTGWDKINL